MTYPFRNYNGLSGTSEILEGIDGDGASNEGFLGTDKTLSPISYVESRMPFLSNKYPKIEQMPEAGYIFGQRVENLWQWAEVLVNSDHFARNSIKDYWNAVLGHEPRPDEEKEFRQLWIDFKVKHNYSIEARLHDLIQTKAFGAP